MTENSPFKKQSIEIIRFEEYKEKRVENMKILQYKKANMHVIGI